MNHYQIAAIAESAASARLDEADDYDAAHEQMSSAMYEALSPNEKAAVFEEAWTNGMRPGDLMAGLVRYWEAETPADKRDALARIGETILSYADNAIVDECDRQATEELDQLMHDAQREGCGYDD